MAVKTYSLKKDGEKRLQPNFRVREFASQDGADEILIDLTLVEYLQKLRDCLQLSSLEIVSGYRTPERNKAVGGAKVSQHLEGKAADVCAYKDGKNLHPKYLCCAAEVLGMTGIALIQTCAHLDTRPYRSWFDENYNNARIQSFGHESWFTYCKVKKLDFMLNPFKKPTDTLKKGMSGEVVKWLQFELIKRGFLTLISANGKCNIDGAFGANTERAVKAFQDTMNLEVDGKFGKLSMAAMK
jgi:hypothetical protein